MGTTVPSGVPPRIPNGTYVQQRAHHLAGEMKLTKNLILLEHINPNNNAHNFLHMDHQKLAQKPLESSDSPLQIGF